MIDIRKKLADIAFENPARPSIVFAYDAGKCSKPIHCGVRTFSITARERIGDKCPVEEWIELAINSVVDKPVMHAGFMDIAWLWVGNIKSVIAAVPIRDPDRII